MNPPAWAAIFWIAVEMALCTAYIWMPETANLHPRTMSGAGLALAAVFSWLMAFMFSESRKWFVAGFLLSVCAGLPAVNGAPWPGYDILPVYIVVSWLALQLITGLAFYVGLKSIRAFTWHDRVAQTALAFGVGWSVFRPIETMICRGIVDENPVTGPVCDAALSVWYVNPSLAFAAAFVLVIATMALGKDRVL